MAAALATLAGVWVVVLAVGTVAGQAGNQALPVVGVVLGVVVAGPVYGKVAHGWSPKDGTELGHGVVRRWSTFVGQGVGVMLLAAIVMAVAAWVFGAVVLGGFSF